MEQITSRVLKMDAPYNYDDPADWEFVEVWVEDIPGWTESQLYFLIEALAYDTDLDDIEAMDGKTIYEICVAQDMRVSDMVDVIVGCLDLPTFGVDLSTWEAVMGTRVHMEITYVDNGWGPYGPFGNDAILAFGGTI